MGDWTGLEVVALGARAEDLVNKGNERMEWNRELGGLVIWNRDIIHGESRFLHHTATYDASYGDVFVVVNFMRRTRCSEAVVCRS